MELAEKLHPIKAVKTLMPCKKRHHLMDENSNMHFRDRRT